MKPTDNVCPSHAIVFEALLRVQAQRMSFMLFDSKASTFLPYPQTEATLMSMAHLMISRYNTCNNLLPKHVLACGGSGCDIFSTKFTFKRDSDEGNVSILAYDICRLIRHHDPAHTIHYLWLSLPCWFQDQYSFSSYILVPATELSGIDGFTLHKLRRVRDKEKTIPSCLDTSSPMIASPVLPQSAFCALEKKLAEVRSFQVFGFRHFKCGEWVLNYSWKASPNRWGLAEFSALFSIGFWDGLWYHRGINCTQYFMILSMIS
jgi:hypothetical protein